MRRQKQIRNQPLREHQRRNPPAHGLGPDLAVAHAHVTEQSARARHLIVDALEARDLAEVKRMIEIHIGQAPTNA
ncbi:hypothetical protein [Ensifer sp. MJa1]|uniref:hypothetical protein n=1 Tax=Ensifer sp. MJa1 TaxID=2919888 RepID=UPI00300BC4EE